MNDVSKTIQMPREMLEFYERRAKEELISFSGKIRQVLSMYKKQYESRRMDIEINTDDNFNNLLLQACQDGAPISCLEYFILRGADVNFLDKEGVSPLWESAMHADTNAMDLLLQRGADPNLGGINGQTPLHAAVNSLLNTEEAIELLLDHGADPSLKDNDGLTALEFAKNEFRQDSETYLNNYVTN